MSEMLDVESEEFLAFASSVADRFTNLVGEIADELLDRIHEARPDLSDLPYDQVVSQIDRAAMFLRSLSCGFEDSRWVMGSLPAFIRSVRESALAEVEVSGDKDVPTPGLFDLSERLDHACLAFREVVAGISHDLYRSARIIDPGFSKREPRLRWALVAEMSNSIAGNFTHPRGKDEEIVSIVDVRPEDIARYLVREETAALCGLRTPDWVKGLERSLLDLEAPPTRPG